MKLNVSRSSILRFLLKLYVGFNAFATEATFLKLGMIVTTVDLYAQVPLLVTFDLYVGHRGSK